jgi:hypothetical protein
VSVNSSQNYIFHKIDSEERQSLVFSNNMFCCSKNNSKNSFKSKSRNVFSSEEIWFVCNMYRYLKWKWIRRNFFDEKKNSFWNAAAFWERGKLLAVRGELIAHSFRHSQIPNWIQPALRYKYLLFSTHISKVTEKFVRFGLTITRNW